MDRMQGGQERRRRFSLAFKQRVVEETLEGGESVSVVTRRHDLNANLLFTWRRRYRQGTLTGGTEERAALLPIGVATTPADKPLSKRADGGELELLLASGHRVRVCGAVEPTLLRTALEVLSR